MPSLSDARDDEPGASRRVVIESIAYASELYVANRSYALVAKGVGRLALDLEPGRYKIRQCIGYSEQVQDLEVLRSPEPCSVQLPWLEFPSPIPLAGTSLVSASSGPRPFSYGSGTFRFILRTPVEESSHLTEAQVEHMHAEMGRLRLESFDGTLSVPFDEAATFGHASGALVFSSEHPPGRYVVVQERDDNRQLCMPIRVCEGRTTAVFSLTLSDEGTPIPVDLGHAAVAMLRDKDLTGEYEQSLVRMEAARKAIAAGRRMYGWSNMFPDGARLALEQPENVLLDLMDVNLGWRCLDTRVADHGEPLPEGEHPLLQVDRGALLARLQKASTVLGRDSADIVALAHALNLDRSDIEILPFASPPLLRRDWDLLLSYEEGNAQAESVMAFPYQVEPSSTWFLWSEERGTRARASDAVQRHARYHSVKGAQDLFPTTLAARRGSMGPLGEIPALMVSLPVKLLSYGLGVMRDVAVERFPPLAQKRPPVVTFEEAELMLAALLENPSFQDWLNKAQLILEAKGKSIGDESMYRLVSGLRSLSDPALLETLGADAVARQVLAALRLPKGRVVQLVKDLLIGVVSQLDQADKAAILAVLRRAVGVAEAWLKTPSVPKKP